MPKLVSGFTFDYLNIDDGKSQPGTDVVRRLTVVSNERTWTETESLGFDSEEYESMNEFFNRDIKKNDAKLVLSNIDKFFKDIKNSKLKKYFIEALTKHVNTNNIYS